MRERRGEKEGKREGGKGGQREGGKVDTNFDKSGCRRYFHRNRYYHFCNFPRGNNNLFLRYRTLAS
jgi:hypothetical protein